VLRIGPGQTGLARIGASTADEAVYRQLLLEPLRAMGLQMTDIDRYAPELHNPEVMEHAGSGDVAHKNYRMIAAMAVRAGAIGKSDMQAFIERIGMVGFAPTQGHIPSGVAYIGHALESLRAGRIERAMILSKASLFLNRLTELYDGVSFVLEANSKNSSAS
jgi:betaine reductase